MDYYTKTNHRRKTITLLNKIREIKDRLNIILNSSLSSENKSKANQRLKLELNAIEKIIKDRN
jgi:hypothetical protein